MIRGSHVHRRLKFCYQAYENLNNTHLNIINIRDINIIINLII